MLPIAVDVLGITDMNLLLPTLGAVLAGAVFGDHCTPISDTTILSSTGAGVHHIDHVVTQLPYAFIAAISAGLGYLFIGFKPSRIRFNGINNNFSDYCHVITNLFILEKHRLIVKNLFLSFVLAKK